MRHSVHIKKNLFQHTKTCLTIFFKSMIFTMKSVCLYCMHVGRYQLGRNSLWMPHLSFCFLVCSSCSSGHVAGFWAFCCELPLNICRCWAVCFRQSGHLCVSASAQLTVSSVQPSGRGFLNYRFIHLSNDKKTAKRTDSQGPSDWLIRHHVWNISFKTFQSKQTDFDSVVWPHFSPEVWTRVTNSMTNSTGQRQKGLATRLSLWHWWLVTSLRLEPSRLKRDAFPNPKAEEPRYHLETSMGNWDWPWTWDLPVMTWLDLRVGLGLDLVLRLIPRLVTYHS